MYVFSLPALCVTCDRCKCTEDYYGDAGRCEPRVEVDKPCRAVGQCVDKAECNLDTNRCQCFVGYFNDTGQVGAVRLVAR